MIYATCEKLAISTMPLRRISVLHTEIFEKAILIIMIQISEKIKMSINPKKRVVNFTSIISISRIIFNEIIDKKLINPSGI